MTKITVRAQNVQAGDRIRVVRGSLVTPKTIATADARINLIGTALIDATDRDGDHMIGLDADELVTVSRKGAAPVDPDDD